MSNYNKILAKGIPLKERDIRKSQTKTTCPKCSSKRKNKTEHCLSVNIIDGVWNCHHCGWSGCVDARKRDYIKPLFDDTPINKELSDYLINERKITQKVIDKMIVTRSEMYDIESNQNIPAIVFNYFRDTELINKKYRSLKKDFRMESGAELIFYNVNALNNHKEIIITEGEFDALSYMVAGFDNVISVPNGASKGNNNLQYLENDYEKFLNLDKIYLSLDNDEAGINLREELARRLGKDICLYIEYPEGCKDANEVLIKYGKERLKMMIENAVYYPMEGVILADDCYESVHRLYDKGIERGVDAPLMGDDFNKLISFKTSYLYIITGIPGHGKSSLMNWLEMQLAYFHNWKFGVFSPESYPLEYLLYRYSELFVGKGFFKNHARMSKYELKGAMDFINEYFYFIKPSDEMYSLDNILEISKGLIGRYGINAITIDPFNTIEHDFSGLSETQYIERFLNKLTLFKQKYDVAIFLVAHPRKMGKISDGEMMGYYYIPTLYDISGSSNFFNKADIGVSVYWNENPNYNRTEVYVQKVKFKNLGEKGYAYFKYNINNGRFHPVIDETNNIVNYNNQPITVGIDYIKEEVVNDNDKFNDFYKDELPF